MFCYLVSVSFQQLSGILDIIQMVLLSEGMQTQFKILSFITWTGNILMLAHILFVIYYKNEQLYLPTVFINVFLPQRP
jgi:hypothetical protein